MLASTTLFTQPCTWPHTAVLLFMRIMFRVFCFPVSEYSLSWKTYTKKSSDVSCGMLANKRWLQTCRTYTLTTKAILFDSETFCCRIGQTFPKTSSIWSVAFCALDFLHYTGPMIVDFTLEMLPGFLEQRACMFGVNMNNIIYNYIYI